MAQITITLDVDRSEIDAKLAKARALVTLLEEAQRMAEALAGPLAVTPPPKRPAAEAPQAVAATNGHRPKAPAERRPRRQHSDETQRAGAVRAREIGATKAAEEFDVVPSVVRGWLKKHPKEHPLAEPIVGTPPKVGESRDEWETRMRTAAGAAL